GYVVLINASAYGAVNAAGFREEICRRLTRALFPDAKDSPAVNQEENQAPSEPGHFRGRWRGAMSHYDGDIPLVLEIGVDGGAKVSFAKQPETQLEKVSYAKDGFTGRMDGVLHTQPSYHGEVTIEFRLKLNDASLQGIAVAEAEGYFALSHWVDLQREPEP
ncbi:MAG TPA: hypothetical protein VGH65_07685, partial [Verrucomicrobiaceae bacterium]